MQTFLPYPDFAASARALDRQRLGKQRLEALNLLELLRGVEGRTGWRSHPALKMWQGHANALAMYGIAVCREWRRRGYKDTLLPRFEALVDRREGFRRPAWFGDPAFHALHYGRLGWAEGPGLPYVWPSAGAGPGPAAPAGRARPARR